MDRNNNSQDLNNLNDDIDSDFNYLTTENVESELKRLKIIDDNYVSDDDEIRDKVRLTGSGIDFRALKAGKDIEFEFDPNKDEDNYDWEDETDAQHNKPDFKQLFQHRNTDVLIGQEEEEEEEGEEPENDESENSDKKTSAQTPFEILRSKMVDISPYKDGGVMKRVLIPGSGLVCPPFARVRVHYNAYFEMNDEPFDSTHLRNKSFEFKLGANQVVYGLEVGVATMKKHEKAQFIFEPEYYIGKFGCEPRVPKETPVLFEVECISFIEANEYEKYENSTDEQRAKVSFKQMMHICNCLREVGNDHFRREQYNEASKRYRKCIYLLDKTSVNTDEDEVKWKAVMLKAYLNMSQICVKQVKPKKAIFYCKMALDLEPNNVKALFRYGHSLRLLQNFERARLFLNKAYNLEPTSRDIIEEIKKLNEAVAKYKTLEKDFYKKMFSGQKVNETNDQCDDFKLEEKESLLKTKNLIREKLDEFVAKENLFVYKVQLHIYSLDIMNFIISEAEARKLTVRDVNGVLQIMKND